MTTSIISQTKKQRQRKNLLTALSFIAPNFIGFFVFTLVPVICSLLLAFLEWDSFSKPKFVGLGVKGHAKM